VQKLEWGFENSACQLVCSLCGSLVAYTEDAERRHQNWHAKLGECAPAEPEDPSRAICYEEASRCLSYQAKTGFRCNLFNNHDGECDYSPVQRGIYVPFDSSGDSWSRWGTEPK
jgi:hypothetical protein